MEDDELFENVNELRRLKSKLFLESLIEKYKCLSRGLDEPKVSPSDALACNLMEDWMGAVELNEPPKKRKTDVVNFLRKKRMYLKKLEASLNNDISKTKFVLGDTTENEIGDDSVIDFSEYVSTPVVDNNSKYNLRSNFLQSGSEEARPRFSPIYNLKAQSRRLAKTYNSESGDEDLECEYLSGSVSSPVDESVDSKHSSNISEQNSGCPTNRNVNEEDENFSRFISSPRDDREESKNSIISETPLLDFSNISEVSSGAPPNRKINGTSGDGLTGHGSLELGECRVVLKRIQNVTSVNLKLNSQNITENVDSIRLKTDTNFKRKPIEKTILKDILNSFKWTGKKTFYNDAAAYRSIFIDPIYAENNKLKTRTESSHENKLFAYISADFSFGVKKATQSSMNEWADKENLMLIGLKQLSLTRDSNNTSKSKNTLCSSFRRIPELSLPNKGNKSRSNAHAGVLQMAELQEAQCSAENVPVDNLNNENLHEITYTVRETTSTRRNQNEPTPNHLKPNKQIIVQRKRKTSSLIEIPTKPPIQKTKKSNEQGLKKRNSKYSRILEDSSCSSVIDEETNNLSQSNESPRKISLTTGKGDTTEKESYLREVFGSFLYSDGDSTDDNLDKSTSKPNEECNKNSEINLQKTVENCEVPYSTENKKSKIEILKENDMNCSNILYNVTNESDKKCQAGFKSVVEMQKRRARNSSKRKNKSFNFSSGPDTDVDTSDEEYCFTAKQVPEEADDDIISELFTKKKRDVRAKKSAKPSWDDLLDM